MLRKHMVSATSKYRDDFESDDNGSIVHYDGCGLIGSHTLCGHTDLTGVVWADTRKPVTCRGCLSVKKHVTGR